MNETDVPNLPYIQAILKETLRLHPPVPLVTRKCIRDNCKIGNYVIPTNTLLFVNIWAIGRDPTCWENPLEFQPERFLKSDDHEKNMVPIDVRGQHFNLLPFGCGTRLCPGINLAMQELPTLLASMIQCFDFKVVGKHGKLIEEQDDALVDMEERPGLTAPRACDLVCVPVARFKQLILDT